MLDAALLALHYALVHHHIPMAGRLRFVIYVIDLHPVRGCVGVCHSKPHHCSHCTGLGCRASRATSRVAPPEPGTTGAGNMSHRSCTYIYTYIYIYRHRSRQVILEQSVPLSGTVFSMTSLMPFCAMAQHLEPTLQGGNDRRLR